MAPVDLGAEIMSEKSTGREKKEHFQPTVAGDRVAPFERWSMDAEEKRELESKAMKLLVSLLTPRTSKRVDANVSISSSSRDLAHFCPWLLASTHFSPSF